ncbi:MAG TPA: methyl-accepting chemotaxis protein [Peptococcaceae bacterium]|nr:methyl-accepting chemotaxis protein [Peptococcaceae bacterium]
MFSFMNLGNRKVGDYERIELDNLERNLQKIINGNFDLDYTLYDDGEDDSPESEQFARINQCLMTIGEMMQNMVADSSKLATSMEDGNLDDRICEDNYKGAFRETAANYNRMLDNITVNLQEAKQVIGKMAVNDYSQAMGTNQVGFFGELATQINEVQNNVLTVQEALEKIAQGDFSQLNSYRQIGQRSESDRLLPALVTLMDNMMMISDEAVGLANAASEGNLEYRAYAEQYNGEYQKIVQKMNTILDAITAPLNEFIVVLTQMEQGNLNVSVTGHYQGEFHTMTNALNSLITTFKEIIQEVTEILAQISQKNLDLSPVKQYQGDFASISKSLNEIVKHLNHVLRDFLSAAEQIAAGSEQVSTSSQTLSEGAENQASSIEQVTSSMSEVDAQVKQNAQNADEARDLSLTAKEYVELGDERMKEMLVAMQEINEASRNISKIIKVIDDIAFQTNILALNAAVEAARAGQYGKGFAVVAEEVRSLAARSASAAKETTQMIESSIAKVEKGTVIAEETNKALNEVVNSISRTADLVKAIATASNEQAMAISQINQAIEQVSHIIQTNSAIAEQSASASEELASQAAMMKQMVNEFTLKDAPEEGKPNLNLNALSPELLRTIEKMMQNKKNGQSEPKCTDTTTKPHIFLDDLEYGKY